MAPGWFQYSLTEVYNGPKCFTVSRIPQDVLAHEELLLINQEQLPIPRDAHKTLRKDEMSLFFKIAEHRALHRKGHYKSKAPKIRRNSTGAHVHCFTKAGAMSEANE